VRGVVLDIKGLPSRTHYHRLKDMLGEFGKVRFLQLIKPESGVKEGEEPPTKKAKAEAADEGGEGDEDEEDPGDEEEEGEEEERPITARCRYFEAEGAQAALAGLQGTEVQGAQVETVLLEGDEEEAYWEETNRRMKEAFENPKDKGKDKGKGKKGKGKGKGKDKGKGKGKGGKGKGKKDSEE